MKKGRRFFLAGAFATAAAPALGRPMRRIPFVGNSFTCEHDIPGRVADLAAGTSFAFAPTGYCKNGWSLTDWFVHGNLFIHGEQYARQNADEAYAYVLQDHSVAPLSPKRRMRSAELMDQFIEHVTRPTILFATWARRKGHALYEKTGMPTTPSAMTEMVHAHYAARADGKNAKVAPVGRAWQRAIARGYDLYNGDGYHANQTGAHLTSLVLAHALGISLPQNDPLAEIAATTPT